MRKSRLTARFLDAVNISAVGLMVAVTIKLGYRTMTDWKSIAILAVSGIVLLKWNKLNTAWIVLGGAVLGYLFFLLEPVVRSLL